VQRVADRDPGVRGVPKEGGEAAPKVLATLGVTREKKEGERARGRRCVGS